MACGSASDAPASLHQLGILPADSKRLHPHPIPPGAQPPAAIATRLAQAAATPWHSFWHDDLSLLEPRHLDWRHVLGSRQLSDVYLLALALHHGGRLVTFDRAVPLDAVPEATKAHLELL